MKYKYTLYNTDGSSQEIGEFPKALEFKDTAKQKGLYSWLDCRTIEIIPRDYYPEADAKNDKVTYFGDKEARFIEGHEANRRMKVLVDNRGGLWDVVGTLVREEKISERASKSN